MVNSIHYGDLQKDKRQFCDYLRMNIKAFDKLLDILHSSLEHKDTNMRANMSPTVRLVVTCYIEVSNTKSFFILINLFNLM